MSNVATPPMIITSQLSHRHPRYSYMNPPITGPVTGPFTGAMDHSDTHRARYSSLAISTMVPGLLDTIAAPKKALFGCVSKLHRTPFHHPTPFHSPPRQ